MKEIRILGLLITDRIKEAGQTQEVLTRFGHIINSRLGFHEVTEETAAGWDLLSFSFQEMSANFDNLESALAEIRGLEVKRMQFSV